MRGSPRSTGLNHKQLSLNLIISSCLFISSLVWPALADGLPATDDCLPKDCGDGLNISYPFWIEGRHLPYCGYPAFKLDCSHDGPVINIYNDDYLVRNISYDDHMFIISTVGLLRSSCPIPRYNLSLGATPFSVNRYNRNLAFFLNCTGTVPGGYRIDCEVDGNGRRSVVGNYSSPESPHQVTLEYASENCDSFVEWPSIEYGTAEADQNYAVLLKSGFFLDWEAVDCSVCTASGGRCRYNRTESRFVCICSDRYRAVSCDGSSPSPESRPHGINRRRKIRIAAGAAAAGLLLAILLCFLLYRKKKMTARTVSSTLPFRTTSSDPPSKKDPEMGSAYYWTHVFRYKELHEATKGFSASNELGHGGFGTVYKGKLRGGRVVAVKRLYENNYKRVEQFLNEVAILSRLRHQNLVTLYGCTSRHSHKLLLVYEYVPNGTVADHLHGDRSPEGALTWFVRLNIAVETATALAYLHAVQPQIIHRDVKTNNILLDNNFHVKVADFGLSRLLADATHVSTAPQGTPGYVDPEYQQCYKLTDKSDVYSFGVVLVELISSKPAVDVTRHQHEINLASMAINKIQNGALRELVDPSLEFETDWKARRMIEQVAELACRCLQRTKVMRPSMEDVVKVLKGIQACQDQAERPRDVDHGAADATSLLKS